MRRFSKEQDDYLTNPVGAESRNRTGTGLPPLDFESSASTNFTTSATRRFQENGIWGVCNKISGTV